MQAQTERLGVAKLDQFFSSHGWLFREQMVHDYGIDAHVEITKENYPSGDLIAIQIKSGKSFFTEQNERAWIFRTEDKHIEYWSNHTLPVILVLYHPEDEILYWQVINEDTVESTGKGWKIEVPKSQTLDSKSLAVLSKLTQPEAYVQKLNKLKLDRYWMEKINDGFDVYVEFDDWVNKSLSRYQINLICEDERQCWPMTYCPGMSVEDALEFFLPWANFEVDLDAHKEGSVGQWDAECYMAYDKESGGTIHCMSFEEWYEEPEGIVPISEDGEVESYRLRLELNEVGEAFIHLDSFLTEKNRFHDRTFTIDDVEW